jgi:CRISPR-associated protein Csb1
MPNPTEFSYAGITVPAGCRRIVISAELEPASDDPRIQPTGFPDVGPVLYPDPSGKHGLICIIESEPSMANRLEEVCLADKYTGELVSELAGLPYIRVTTDGKPAGELKTASTLDSHRIASEYLTSALGKKDLPAFRSYNHPSGTDEPLRNYIGESLKMTPDKKKQKWDKCPLGEQANIFALVAEMDPLSLVHGFQFSSGFAFVGLRSPRALNASIVGLDCERIFVPGVRIDPISEGDANQAIFQKQRITAKRIVVRYSIDVALLASMRLQRLVGTPPQPGPLQSKRFELLVKIALFKVLRHLQSFDVQNRLRSECPLRIKRQGEKLMITCQSDNEPLTLIDGFPQVKAINIKDGEFGDSAAVSPLTLKYKKPSKKKDEEANADEQPENVEVGDSTKE